MKNAGIVLLLTCASVSLAHADVVGTLNVHTMSDGHKTTGRDSGQPIAVQVDFSKTQDGTYDVTVWSGDRQFDKTTRVYVQEGKAARREGELPKLSNYHLLSSYRSATKRGRQVFRFSSKQY
jgi:hypothetical protein